MDRPTILALATYPQSAAATRFRLLQMLPHLRTQLGWDVRFEPFIEDDFFRNFYGQRHPVTKAKYLAARSLERLATVLRVQDVHAVFIQREAALLGPPYAEFVLHSLKGLPIILDFDDAIWDLNLEASVHPRAARFLKDSNKCWYTMRRAAGIVAGSQYLAERARKVNSNVFVVPTVVSSKSWTPLPCRMSGEHHREGPPRIGWIGSHTTAPQLDLVEPALRQLRAEGYEFEVHVVGAGESFGLKTVETKSRSWRIENEITEFQQVDIGLAPMRDHAFYQGKCGFKQLQYMAVGVPFVTSWVGGARDFVVEGQNGLVASTAKDWYQHLKALLESKELRARLSRVGRKLVEKRYCSEVQGPRLAEILSTALERE